ncbi:hypothetical protein GXM_00124 [Nostoc sphaeroides CCNUC1]|uniref:Uncharacterized protein n=1 Tax=Nostoc sphaeroides CCNUC1 TaxID=2653204 RepID=A0A5P8VQV1_9NOSO|nr:hypothetical protein GXM_00124 [Nostoc sphaeroides CCNUC1]
MRNETQHLAGFVGFRKASTQPTNILNRVVLRVILSKFSKLTNRQDAKSAKKRKRSFQK